MLKAVGNLHKPIGGQADTPEADRQLLDATLKQQPPRLQRVHFKMRYAHQGEMNHADLVGAGSALDHVPASYVRYLERAVSRSDFKLQGTPLRIQFKSSHNPFASKGFKSPLPHQSCDLFDFCCCRGKSL